MRIFAWLLAACLGGVIAIGGQHYLESKKHPSLSNPVKVTRPPSAPFTQALSKPVPQHTLEAIRRIILVALDATGVSAGTVQFGQYPLRGPGRERSERFPLVSFTCSTQSGCDEAFKRIGKDILSRGFQFVRPRENLRPQRIRYRAIAHDGRPVLALRAFLPGPRLSVVIGDVGQEPGVLDRLLALPEDVTYAVLANSQYAPSISQRLTQRGREVIAHLPMEPLPPRAEDGPSFIRTRMPLSEVRRLTLDLLARVPGAVGADGHLGGKLTSSRTHIGEVLKTLGERGLFFLDGRPADTSIALPVARSLGIRTAVRTHRIEADHQDIGQKLKAVEMSLVLDGQALVIASPQPGLLAELDRWLKGLTEKKINLMRLSEIVL